jgi:hypothetical protein
MISLICKKYGITNYIVNPDGSIDVDGDVDLSFNDLTEFPLRFNRVDGDFRCNNNNLTSLKGCPRWVGGYFDCDDNKLTSLEFSPDHVGGYFSCIDNDLTDNYCDTEMGDNFYTSLKQDGLRWGAYITVGYNRWRKLYKRKQILNELYTRHM